MKNTEFNIGAVERETGLSKDVLRVWERRYGFPSPRRDAHGERLYPPDQVDRLQLVKRLMDTGHRPGKLLGLEVDALTALAREMREKAAPAVARDEAEALQDLLKTIRQHDAPIYVHAMQQRLARQGLGRFVQDTVAPLVHIVGEAWEAGNIEIFEEHFFTELTQRLLRNAISALPAVRHPPRLLLTTAADEQHSLGLLMVEALLALEGADCLPLGTQTPLGEINRAVRAYQADIIALSFSAAFPHRQIPALVTQLQELLPPSVEIWLGGSGITRLNSLPGVCLLPKLEDTLAALNAWRAARVSST